MAKQIRVKCDDVCCGFKQRRSDTIRYKNECCLYLSEAKAFFEKYGITTCELGMGEATIYGNEEDDKYLIKSIRLDGFKK